MNKESQLFKISEDAFSSHPVEEENLSLILGTERVVSVTCKSPECPCMGNTLVSMVKKEEKIAVVFLNGKKFFILNPQEIDIEFLEKMKMKSLEIEKAN